LVRKRGTYMQDAVPVGRGAMAALIGGELAAIERACREASGVVEAVNYNSPGQLVIAGEAEAIKALTPTLQGLGCKVMPLPVSAPFHSSLMRPAEEQLTPHLAAAEFRDPRWPVYVNVDASPVITAAAARDALGRQISRPVRWQESVARMIADGVSLFVEIGPGRVLSGLLRRIDKNASAVNVQTPEDFVAAREAIAKLRSA
jgi:[acyl-carrier-protein] S-malonyltransferase